MADKDRALCAAEGVVVSEMPRIPAGSNPFHHDSYHMGTPLVRDWMAMHDGYGLGKHSQLTYVILINTRTGKRLKILLPQD